MYPCKIGMTYTSITHRQKQEMWSLTGSYEESPPQPRRGGDTSYEQNWGGDTSYEQSWGGDSSHELRDYLSCSDAT